jgi:hypothetical protein
MLHPQLERIVRNAFTQTEWAILAALPGFLASMDTLSTLEQAEQVMRQGQTILSELVETTASEENEEPTGV